MYPHETLRRSFFHLGYGAPGLAASLNLWPANAADGKRTKLTPNQALEKLKKGHADFLADNPSVKPTLDHGRRL